LNNRGGRGINYKAAIPDEVKVIGPGVVIMDPEEQRTDAVHMVYPEQGVVPCSLNQRKRVER
jgi:hypothetical protein